jgi:hypothetical protein
MRTEIYIPKEIVEHILSFVQKCKVKQLDTYHYTNVNYTLQEQIMNIFRISIKKNLVGLDELIEETKKCQKDNFLTYWIKICIECGWDYYKQFLRKKYKNDSFRNVDMWTLKKLYEDNILKLHPYDLVPKQFIIYHFFHSNYTKKQLLEQKNINLHNFLENTERRFVNYLIKQKIDISNLGDDETLFQRKKEEFFIWYHMEHLI